MTSRTLAAFLVTTLVAGTIVAWAQTPPAPSVFSAEPAVSLKDALALAEQYVADKQINVSRHFLESVRLVHLPASPKGDRQWIVTWALKTPSDGGQLFIHVKMDRSVSKTGGL